MCSKWTRPVTYAKSQNKAFGKYTFLLLIKVRIWSCSCACLHGVVHKCLTLSCRDPDAKYHLLLFFSLLLELVTWSGSDVRNKSCSRLFPLPSAPVRWSIDRTGMGTVWRHVEVIAGQRASRENACSWKSVIRAEHTYKYIKNKN